METMPDKFADMKARFELATKDEVHPAYKPEEPMGFAVSLSGRVYRFLMLLWWSCGCGCGGRAVVVAVFVLDVVDVVVDGTRVVVLVLMLEILITLESHAIPSTEQPSLQHRSQNWGPATCRARCPFREVPNPFPNPHHAVLNPNPIRSHTDPKRM